MPKKHFTSQSNEKSSENSDPREKSNLGFYKSRRGIVEHIESGTIDLLENGIHDYLSLKANLLIGNGYHLPAGVVSISAPALCSLCNGISERTMQRKLAHLEEIGWLKFSPWRTPGKRGNYLALLCRASVHDLSGNEYRVNGELTTDWRHPVYEPVGELSSLCRQAGVTLSGNREVREEKEAEEAAATSTPVGEEKKERCLEAWKAIGEDPFGPKWFVSGWEKAYADRPEDELLGDTMEEFIQHCQDSGGPMPPKRFFDAKHRIEKQESEDDSEVRRVAGPRGVREELMR